MIKKILIVGNGSTSINVSGDLFIDKDTSLFLDELAKSVDKITYLQFVNSYAKNNDFNHASPRKKNVNLITLPSNKFSVIYP